MTQSMSRRGDCWERQRPAGTVAQEPEVRRVDPVTGYISLREAKRNTSYYLMDYYNWRALFPKSAIRLQRPQPQVTVTLGAFLQADQGCSVCLSRSHTPLLLLPDRCIFAV